MSAAEQKLFNMAAAKFQNLTEAETELLCAAAIGKPADCRDQTADENDPKHAGTWGEPRTIRAEILRWLCADREAVKHVDPKGIRIEAAKIIGQLDFEAVTMPFPLALARCAIQDGINLTWAKTRLLNFEGSASGPITGPGLAVRGDIFLSQGFWAQGEVQLTGATITRDLECRGGRFDNPGGNALEASEVTVGGNVTLSAAFQADGTVGAPFHATGKVSLAGARIAGTLACHGGRFDNPGRDALQAAAITVGGVILLNQGFRAKGLIDLTGGNVGSYLDFNGAQFIGKARNGLRAENLTVKGIFDWRNVVKTDSTILDLWGARVGQLADDKRSWPKCQNLYVDDFIYAAIADGPMDATTRVDWLKRQADQPLNPKLKPQASRLDSFRPKPYQQLAKVLRESGHEAAAKRILIAKEWARGKYGRVWLGHGSGTGYYASPSAMGTCHI